MDSQLVILLSVAVVSALVALVLYFLKKCEKKEHEMSQSEIAKLREEYAKLQSILIGLIKKIESMAIVDRDVDSKLAALQALAGVNREQLKYLTSSVNSEKFTTS